MPKKVSVYLSVRLRSSPMQSAYTVSTGDRVHVPPGYQWWLRMHGERFIDVTAHPDLDVASGFAVKNATYPANPRRRDELAAAFELVSDQNPRKDLAQFTSFYTRYYWSPTGVASQEWLLHRVKHVAAAMTAPTSVTTFKHDWPQSTIILHITGRNATLTAERGVTIVGAHQDSTNLFPLMRAPGADDDGSGTVTLLETLRVLGETRWTPESDVEFHRYSAEEGGLLGSQDVVAAYKASSTHVYAMLQQDMTAYVRKKSSESVGIVTDFVSPALTDFVELLVQTYLSIPPKRTLTSYGASDHAAWHRAGYPSAFAIEAPFEECNLRKIHTTSDTADADGFSFSHLLEFVRLTLAFVVELSG